jgi:hypothetical protein
MFNQIKDGKTEANVGLQQFNMLSRIFKQKKNDAKKSVTKKTKILLSFLFILIIMQEHYTM